MLFPQTNEFREEIDISGIWEISFDSRDVGKAKEWQKGLENSQPIAVPASWNDQVTDKRDYLGPAWYQTWFHMPKNWIEKKVFLRFGSVNYFAEIWVNGNFLGSHKGGHLPFEFEISESVQPGANLLILRVDGRLGYETVPPGNLDPDDVIATHIPYPNTSFDFFPYCGIHRSVLLYSNPKNHIEDITVTTDIQGSTGILHIQWQENQNAHITLKGKLQSVQLDSLDGETTIEIQNAELWSPDNPFLYDLTIELLEEKKAIDSYSLPVGIRTVKVDGDALLLNGKPIHLRGFGRHEDFPIYGRGFAPPVMIKDFDLMQWVGANSFRTTHYPYAEQQLALADRLGFLVIDETPAVGLFFKNEHGLEKRNALCRQMLKEMIQRDKNHPSVVMWSLANEPYSDHPRAVKFFHELYNLTTELDDTRPVTIARHARAADGSYDFLDVVCLNLYYGWYQQQGRLDEGLARLDQELEDVYQRFKKPIILTEFGADTLPGHHALPPEMFSEEYQAAFIEGYLKVVKEKPYVVGSQIWNLCDFKTGQAVHRMGSMNYKGVFTRDRRPKMAAHRLRDLWGNGSTP